MEELPSLKPIVTLMSLPAAARLSCRFCAWAGAWDPQPMTPMELMPSKALGRRGKRSLPPLRMVSVVSASLTSSVVKTLEVKAERDVEGEEVETERMEGEKAGVWKAAAEPMRARVVARNENFMMKKGGVSAGGGD